jgi:hypothetical protein
MHVGHIVLPLLADLWLSEWPGTDTPRWQLCLEVNAAQLPLDA